MVWCSFLSFGFSVLRMRISRDRCVLGKHTNTWTSGVHTLCSYVVEVKAFRPGQYFRFLAVSSMQHSELCKWIDVVVPFLSTLFVALSLFGQTIAQLCAMYRSMLFQRSLAQAKRRRRTTTTTVHTACIHAHSSTTVPESKRTYQRDRLCV